LLRLSAKELRDRAVERELKEAYPSSRFVRFYRWSRLERNAYYLYLAGQATLLVGGSGVLIGLYRLWARRTRFSWFAAPLQEIDRRPVLVWGVHLVYFGLVMLSSVLVYELPEVQTVLMSAIRAEIGSSSGPLGIAGKAYGSRNVALAALVTFAINFGLGSVLLITVPSMVVPGTGALATVVRAFAWGLMLAPTFEMNAYAMLPHSLTMLLEGGGYILAAFFALMIPISMVESRPGTSVGQRYLRALVLNVQGNLVVALVLTVAACYEAVEVIAMMN
jgi:hypothetical protein